MISNESYVIKHILLMCQKWLYSFIFYKVLQGFRRSNVLKGTTTQYFLLTQLFTTDLKRSKAVGQKPVVGKDNSYKTLSKFWNHSLLMSSLLLFITIHYAFFRPWMESNKHGQPHPIFTVLQSRMMTYCTYNQGTW